MPIKHYTPGLLRALLLAILALLLASRPTLAAHGVSALTLAMLGGVLLGNLRPHAASQAGIRWCKQRVLRAGIVLFGLQLTLADVVQLGGKVVLIDGAVLLSTFVLAQWLGRALGLDRQSCVLIGAGSAICGAAAVLATQPVIRADSERSSVAVAGVVLFGSVAMLVYPWLYTLLAPWGLSQSAYGVLTGSTLHEVAQVVAAGKAVSDPAAATAVITKMLRVMMLAPFLLGLSAWWQRQQASGTHTQTTAGMPWFALGFVLAVLLNSSGWLAPAPVHALLQLDQLLLAVAMAALGLDTRISAIRAAGWRPLLLAGLLFVWLLLGGGAINLLLNH